MGTETFLVKKEYVKSFPMCAFRLGRLWDSEDDIAKKAVVTCGGSRKITTVECIQCGGFKNPMLKKEITGFTRDDYNVLKCDLNKKCYKR